MTLPAISAASVASAYGRVDAGKSASLEGFGNALTQALQGVVDAGHQADAQSAQGIAGTANLTDVVTAVNRAELALQTTTAIRDRVVSAYQDIMRMPI
jgi:flagellar hook-basal body complex protein FliE